MTGGDVYGPRNVALQVLVKIYLMFAQTHQSDFTSTGSFHVATSNTKDPGDQVMPSFFSLIRHFQNFCQWPHKL